jgi:two-component system, OmpR family, KDP operon response regulator KdpE
MSKDGARILVVDDEPEIVRALQRSLTIHEYRVLVATSGEEAIDVALQQRADLLLLDLMLPDMSGLEVCRRVRAVSNIPIIILSVKDAERDKVEALDLGADDYIAKPFGINEVLARVRVALRHASMPPKGTAPCFQAGPLSVNFDRRRVSLAGKEVALTPTEYDLLKVFIIHRGKVLTRQHLLKAIWGSCAQGRMHSLHVYVAQLRQKIEPVPACQHFIFTIPGVGYRFADEAER